MFRSLLFSLEYFPTSLPSPHISHSFSLHFSLSSHVRFFLNLTPSYAALFLLFLLSFLQLHPYSSLMANRFILFLSMGLFFPFPTLGFLFKTKFLPPPSNVHIDVVNYVTGPLQSHVHPFHYSWRDYSILLLFAIDFDTCLLTCCGLTVICIYRHLLIRLGRSSSPPLDTLRPGPSLGIYQNQNLGFWVLGFGSVLGFGLFGFWVGFGFWGFGFWVGLGLVLGFGFWVFSCF